VLPKQIVHVQIFRNTLFFMSQIKKHNFLCEIKMNVINVVTSIFVYLQVYIH